MVRQCLQKLDRALGKENRLLASDHQHTDKFIRAEQRHDQNRPEAGGENGIPQRRSGVSSKSGICTASLSVDAQVTAALSSTAMPEIAAIIASLMP